MLKRCDVFVLLGTATVFLGGALFLNAFGNEPIWAEWLLGPGVAFAGVILGIIGIALRCYAADRAADPGSPKVSAVVKPIH